MIPHFDHFCHTIHDKPQNKAVTETKHHKQTNKKAIQFNLTDTTVKIHMLLTLDKTGEHVYQFILHLYIKIF